MKLQARSRTARLRAFNPSHCHGRLLRPFHTALHSRCLHQNAIRPERGMQPSSPCSVAEKQGVLPFWSSAMLSHASLAAGCIASLVLSGQADASATVPSGPFVGMDTEPQLQQHQNRRNSARISHVSLSHDATSLAAPSLTGNHSQDLALQTPVTKSGADVAETNTARLSSSPYNNTIPAGLELPGGFHLPLMALSARGGGDVWIQLGAIIAANVIGVKAFLAVMSRFSDRSEPLTLVRLQFGLVQPATGVAMLGKAGSMAHLRTRLGQLAGMIQMGQHGLWLIVEEAVLELSRHQQAAALADVEVIHLDSKQKAYQLLGRLAKQESSKARAEDAVSHAFGEGTCTPDWESEPSTPQQATPALIQWLTGKAGHAESSCDDALIVTLVVTARGHLHIPSSVNTWQDACQVMKGLCGLSSSQLMGVDLTWAPARDGTFLTREELQRDYANLKPIKH